MRVKGIFSKLNSVARRWAGVVAISLLSALFVVSVLHLARDEELLEEGSRLWERITAPSISSLERKGRAGSFEELEKLIEKHRDNDNLRRVVIASIQVLFKHAPDPHPSFGLVEEIMLSAAAPQELRRSIVEAFLDSGRYPLNDRPICEAIRGKEAGEFAGMLLYILRHPGCVFERVRELVEAGEHQGAMSELENLPAEELGEAFTVVERSLIDLEIAAAEFRKIDVVLAASSEVLESLKKDKARANVLTVFIIGEIEPDLYEFAFPEYSYWGRLPSSDRGLLHVNDVSYTSKGWTDVWAFRQSNMSVSLKRGGTSHWPLYEKLSYERVILLGEIPRYERELLQTKEKRAKALALLEAEKGRAISTIKGFEDPAKPPRATDSNPSEGADYH